jgi:AcrR family transcriptional regulator
MTTVKKVSRQDRAAATRRRMLDAAYDLFCEQGFRATTMETIADRAGVAVQTLYFTFHTKDALLQEVHNRTVLGEEGTPPQRQEWHLAAMAEPDVHRAVEMLVRGNSQILHRVAPMMPVFHSVSADAAGKVFRKGEQRRRDGCRVLADELVAKAPMAPGMTADGVSDLLFVLLGPQTYRSFVIELGWTREQWADWTTHALVRDIFGPNALSR